MSQSTSKFIQDKSFNTEYWMELSFIVLSRLLFIYVCMYVCVVYVSMHVYVVCIYVCTFVRTYVFID